MGVYKVPQDVEAEDKLLGPFSFKQFLFLIVAIVALGVAYALSQILLPLALLPIPVALFFGALALPLKKDQPMEVYLAAIVSFMTKPKQRLWNPDGIETLVEVTAPRVVETHQGKGYRQEEVQRRLSYLANLVDSHGWAVRGVDDPNSSMRYDFQQEANATEDILDTNNSTAQQINLLMNQSENQRREELLQNMHKTQDIQLTPQITSQQPPIQYQQATQAQSSAATIQPQAAPETQTMLHVDPYPTMHQSVITPLGAQPQATSTNTITTPSPIPSPQPTTTQETPNTEQSTSETPVSPAIMDLAKNHQDMSIETLSREANRINNKEALGEEVVVSLH